MSTHPPHQRTIAAWRLWLTSLVWLAVLALVCWPVRHDASVASSIDQANALARTGDLAGAERVLSERLAQVESDSPPESGTALRERTGLHIQRMRILIQQGRTSAALRDGHKAWRNLVSLAASTPRTVVQQTQFNIREQALQGFQRLGNPQPMIQILEQMLAELSAP